MYGSLSPFASYIICGVLSLALYFVVAKALAENSLLKENLANLKHLKKENREKRDELCKNLTELALAMPRPAMRNSSLRQIYTWCKHSKFLTNLYYGLQWTVACEELQPKSVNVPFYFDEPFLYVYMILSLAIIMRYTVIGWYFALNNCCNKLVE